jgi:tRNA (cmo5U34)-methyltransferase
MWERYGACLTELRDEAYRDHVFAYAAKEDSARPLDLLRSAGFNKVELLGKNSCFAGFGAIKESLPV